ncbi:MAG: tetratricopeptide repeat protein [Phycisphaerae bacterium]|nr:tetratricopeptide repeat protein [Phycisphaerae bacterium]
MDIKKRRQTVRRRRVEAFKFPQVQPIKAAQQCPEGPPAFLVQALDHVRAGRLDSAIDLLKQYAKEDPMTVYGNLGSIYLLQNRFKEAQDALQKVFETSPQSIDTAVNLAHALASQHQVGQAVEILLVCLRRQQKSPAIRVLTKALAGYQAQDAALTTMQSLYDSMPDNLEIQFERAIVLKITGHLHEAEQAFLGVLEKQAHMCVYYELARLYRDTHRPSRAISCLQQAAALNPDQGELYHDLGNAYCQAGLADEGVAILRQALDKAPDDKMLRSDFLQQSHTLPDATPEALFQGYQEWARRHAPASLSWGMHYNQPDPDRTIRIGYLSPDFSRHSVSCFIEPLLEGHHRDKVRVYGYGHVLEPDAASARLKGRFDHYCDIVALDDQAVAQRIKQDGIDILVDLAGHTTGSRLGVMALKPAPVQVTYLGHPDTTGLPQIDYRITDAKAESERSRQCTTETLVDLPQGCLCYRPPDVAPEVTQAPFMTNGYVTFGSFNHHASIHKHMIALWSQILLNIPDARFLLKLHVADDEAVKAMYRECFEHYGVTADRLDIHTCGSPEDHLASVGSVDIALDTYPCNGTTITCESLWMGVPVVTLKGDLSCSRMGYSLLSQLGMEFLAVDTPEAYVTMASALASKPEAISQMRDSMRLRMGASTLLKADAFAGQLEAAYRYMWETWCQRTQSQTPEIKD